MAAEGAARAGSRAAGMLCSLWVLVLVSSVLALEGKREGETGEPPPASTGGDGKGSEKAEKPEDIKQGKGMGKLPEKGP